MWQEWVIAVHMVNNNKYKNSEVNEPSSRSQLSVGIAMGLPSEWIKRGPISSFFQIFSFSSLLHI